jgi:hypothetical protein
MDRRAYLNTLPALPAIATDRGALVAGVAFVEGVGAGWGRAELSAWIEEHLVAPGRMLRPATMSEAIVGAIALDPATSATGPRVATLAELPKLLAVARSRVVVALRAFVATPPDDRFLKAALFAGRVERVRVGNNNVWLARPREQDHLGDVVLSLFAADVLMQREFHEQNLCVCEVCGRVSFQRAVTTVSGCAEHLPRSETQSGFQRAGSSRPPPFRDDGDR